MSKPWSAVASSPAFQQLPAADQDAARRQYFDEVVSPRVPATDRETAWSQFDADTRIAKQDLPASVKPSAAGAGRGGTTADPRRLDTPEPTPLGDPMGTGGAEIMAQPAKPASVLEGQVLPEPEVTPAMQAENARLSTRTYAERTPVPGAPARTTAGPGERQKPNHAEDVGRMAGDTGFGGRAVAKAASGAAEGVWGAVRAGAELVGADRVAKLAKASADSAKDFDTGMGAAQPLQDFGPRGPAPYLQDMAEGAATSLGQSAAFALGFGPKAVIPLLSLQSAGQQYQQARAQGLSPAAALANALPYGAFEAVGEKLGGLDKAAKALNTIVKGGSRQEIKDAGAMLLQAGIKEIPSEWVTYLGQTAVDLLPGIGLRQDLTGQQFLDGLRDTTVQAAMMGTAMGGGGAIAQSRVRGAPAERTAEQIARDKGFLLREDRIKQLNTSGEKEVAGVLQRRLDSERAESELQGLAHTQYGADPDFQQRYRTMRSQGVKPAEASSRAAMLSGFAQIGSQAGLSPKAIERAAEAASKMPLDEVPAYLERFTASLSQRGMGSALPDGTVAGAVGAVGDDAMHTAVDNIARLLGVDQVASTPEGGAGAAAVPESQAQAPAPLEAPPPGAEPEAAAVHSAATSPLNDLPEPTQAQKDAGNYKVGRLRIAGMDISVENPQGSVRRGVSPDGKAWETPLQDHYGYIRGTVGADKDHVDVFVKPGTPEDYRGPVFVVDQVDPSTGKFDEHKVVIGAASQAEAEQVYRRNYEAGWQGLGAITQLPMRAFQAWAASKKHTREPLGDIAAARPQQPQGNDASLPKRQEGETVLQNRNRATPSSIAQMRSIAAAPDYGRLGFSRDFGNGAPVVSGGSVPESQLGRADVAVTADGRRIPVRYAVVDAGSVLASHSADGSPSAGYGADGATFAIAGNGRIAGLQAAYQGRTADAYRKELLADGLHGVNPNAIEGVRAPVLVRVMAPQDVTPDIGDVSNTSGNLNLSAVEQAQNDARRVDLEALSFADDGAVTAEAVRQFVRAMPQSEQGALLDTNGQPTRQAVDRINAAIFWRAYGNEQLVRLYAQAQDPEARLVLSALAQVAPKMARLEGAGDLDIRPIVADAAQIAVNARRDGISIARAAAQADLDADAAVQVVLDIFAASPRSTKPVVEALARAADFAYTESSKPAEDMFGSVPKASRQDVVHRINGDDTSRPQDVEQSAGREVAGQNAPGREAGQPGPQGGGRAQEIRAAEADEGSQYRVAEPADLFGDAPNESQQQAGRLRGERTEAARRQQQLAPEPGEFDLGMVDSRNGTEVSPKQPDLLAQPKPPNQNGSAPYETDLFGNSIPRQQALPDSGSTRPRRAEPDRRDIRGDAQSAAAVPAEPGREQPGDAAADIPGSYYVDTFVSTETRRKVGTDQVRTPAELAQATRYLYKSAVERFDAIVTDTGGKILAVVGGFKGATSQTSIYPGTLAAEALRVPGAAHIWFSHNHPSGTANLSAADLRLNALLEDVFKGSGIRPMGLVAVTGERFSFNSSGTEHEREVNTVQRIPDGGQPTEVPVYERELADDRVTPLAIGSPQDAKVAARNFFEKQKEAGLILLDAQNKVAGWLPVGKLLAGKLRDTGGLALLYRAISRSNASAAIIVHGGDLDRSPTSDVPSGPILNIGKALSQLDVRLLDSIKIHPSTPSVSRAEQGLPVVGNTLYARGENAQRRSGDRETSLKEAQAKLRALRGASIADAQKIVDSLTAKWKGGPKVSVVATTLDLPGENPPDVRGLYTPGHIYIVAGAHRSGKDLRRSLARTLAHEAVAHFGLRHMLGRAGWNQLMKNVRLAIEAGNKPLTAIQAYVRETYKNKDGSYSLHPDAEADEIAAKAVEDAIDADGNFKPGFGFFKEVWAKVAQFLRDLGINVTFTNAELQGMLVLSMHNMERGQRAVGGGQMAVAAAREDGPMQARDGKPRKKSLARRLREEGEQVLSIVDAERRMNDGEEIYGFHEQDDATTPIRVLAGDLGNWTSDQLLALPIAKTAGSFDDGTPSPEHELQPWQVASAPKLHTALRRWTSGKADDAQLAAAVRAELDERKAKREAAVDADRVRGADWVRERLLRARRTGELSTGQVDLVMWMLGEAPHLASELGISIRSGNLTTPNGLYNTAERVVTVFANKSTIDTATHEILHHTERMMPREVQAGIRREWLRQLERAAAKAKTDLLARKDAPPTNGPAGWTAVEGTVAPMSTERQLKLLDMMLLAARNGDADLTGMLWAGPQGMRDVNLKNVLPYELSQPSEFWAVNGAALMRGKAEAEGDWIAKAKLWLRGLLERAKELLRLPSDAAVLRGIRAVMEGDGSFVSRDMISTKGATFSEEGNAFDGTQHARGAAAGDQQEEAALPATPRPLSRWRDATGRLQFAPGQALYDLIGKAADPLLSAVQLKAASPALRRALREMKNEVRKAQETAAAVAGETNKLSPAERAMVSDIVEREIAAGTIPPEHAVRLATLINSVMGQQTDELVRLGMLTEDSAERWRDQYLPRFYESKLTRKAADAWADAMRRISGRARVMKGIGGKHLRGRGLYETIPESQLQAYEDMGWEVRDPDYNPGLPSIDGTVQVWRDFTRAERDDMGEIRDAGFRFVMGYMQTQRDIALGKMFEALAANPEISSRTAVGKLTVQVPTSTVEGTGAKTYGKLAGRFVSKDTLSHLSSIEEAQSEALQLYRKAMGWWKLGKTAMNPVSHVNNVLSNLTMAHFAGVSYWDGHKYAGAVYDLASGGEMVKEAKDAGLFGGTMSEAELLNILPPELRKLAATQEGLAPKVGRAAFDIMTFFLRRPMGWAYQAEDSFFRYLIYRDARGRGIEPADAVDYAQKFIFAYDDLPKGARVIRDFGIPFFSYTYKAAPVLLHTALTHPLRMAAPAALLWAANAAAYAIAAGDNDDDWEERLRKYLTDPEQRKKAREMEQLERENLPPWMKGTTALLTPKTVRLGMDELTKLPLFIDISRIVPGGDLFDVSPNAGGLPIPQPLTPSNPLFTTAVAMIGNKDLFLGKEVTDSNDTKGEAAQKRAAWLWLQLAPAIAAGGYHWQRGMSALAQATGKEITWMPDALGGDATGIGRDGLPVQPKFAAMQTFGIKVRPIDIDRSEAIGDSLRNKMIRDIDAEMRSLKRLHGLGAIGDRAFDNADEAAQVKKDRLKDGLTVDGDEKK